MKHRMTPVLAPVLALSLLTTPVSAQQDDGFSLMEEGARLFLRGLMDEMGPALDELEGMAREITPQMRDFATTMGPALRDLMGQVSDWSVYMAPEILENGDIIIRRKPDMPLDPEQPAPDAQAPEPLGEIEL